MSADTCAHSATPEQWNCLAYNGGSRLAYQSQARLPSRGGCKAKSQEVGPKLAPPECGQTAA